MSDKQHTVAIGAFMVGAILIAVLAAVFITGVGFGQEKRKVVMVFDGSIKGLIVGAPVALRGVQIGQVTKIELILDSDTVEVFMLVEAVLNSENIRLRGQVDDELMEELIAQGMRAQLNTQSLLTGLLYIQLDLHPQSSINLADVDSPYLQIPTIPTELERITREVEQIDIAKIARDMENTLNGLNQFVTGESFQEIPATLQMALSSVTTLSDELLAQLASSGPRLDRALDEASTTLHSAKAEIPDLSAALKQSLTGLDRATRAFEEAMGTLEGTIGPDSATAYQLNRALEEIAEAGQALQALARTLEEQPEALMRGKNEEGP
jgi:paraquat-inducible protein B